MEIKETKREGVKAKKVDKEGMSEGQGVLNPRARNNIKYNLNK